MSTVPTHSVPVYLQPDISPAGLPDDPCVEAEIDQAAQLRRRVAEQQLESVIDALAEAAHRQQPAPVKTTLCRCWTSRFRKDRATVIVPGVGRVDAHVWAIEAESNHAVTVELFNRICQAEEDGFSGDPKRATFGKPSVALTDADIALLRKAAGHNHAVTGAMPAAKPITRAVRMPNPNAWR